MRVRRDETGAFLVVWALLLTALLIMVAIVIDLGQLRDTKRQAQLTSDFAAIAAGRKLAGTPSGSGFTVDSQGACLDAFEYVRSNTVDLPVGASMAGATGCGSLPVACTNEDLTTAPPTSGTSPADAVATGSGPYSIAIRYPVPYSEIVDPRLPGARLSDGKMCERMRVTIGRDRKTFFAGVVGITSLTTKASSVIRGYGTSTPENVPALALLERVGCGVLFTQAASPSSRLIIEAVNPTNPGIIQADSYGVPNRGTCDSANSNPAKRTNKIVFGEALSSGQPSIETKDCRYDVTTPAATTCSATGTQTTKGLLLLNAIRVGSPFGAYQMGTDLTCPGSTCGVRSTLGGGQVASRQLVDNKYLTEVRALHTSSDSDLDRANTVAGRASLLASGYKVYPDSYGVGCGDMPVPPVTTPPTPPGITDPYVLVRENCDLNPSSSGRTLTFTGTHFIVAGKISVGSGNTLTFPNAQQILVAGCSPTVTNTGPTPSGGCGNSAGGQNIGINVAGRLLVNGRTAAAGACPAVSTSYSPGVLVVRTGRIETSTSSTTALCQTFVYLSGIEPADAGNSMSTSATDHPSCATPPATIPPTPALPCPIVTPDNLAHLNIQGTVTWLAPNQSPTAPRDRTAANQKFEDLALWAEGSETSSIKGTGSTNTSGLFYFPNATFTFQGQSCTTPRDAQFFSRRLELSGTSCFLMKPLPQNSVSTPKPSFTLIR